ncbi:MAG: AzlC family ABC transporter permease [Anaerolineales bacterium]|uniref:AzlC family ABC transporter permease n=1 Tax=Candidatus Villigracilis saccharophilus TaxID=3140684 RepID=UPI003136DD55|nr:AzlC family ABC transporter permease [Anaerolineales bacterium]MBK8419091.1 AzlC family ABC transporter permease [Anaerolineales bacterium]
MRINKDFLAGARGALPILIGVVPFAMISGVAAVSVGLTFFETLGMSVLVFAGASQLVVFQLMSAGSPWLIMVLTAWVINLRFTMYSATLAPYLQKLSLWQKALLAYMLSDQAFGVSLTHFVTNETVSHRWFYFGSALTVWVAWQISAVIGSLLGALVPASWGFDFAFPLSFMALMFGSLRDRPTVVAALTGGIIAVLAKGLPYNIGLVLATFLGIAAGYLVENRRTAS